MSDTPMHDPPRAARFTRSAETAVFRGRGVQIVEGRPPEEISFPSGRVLTVSSEVDEEAGQSEGESITVRSPTGEVELSIRFTAEGPKLRFQAAELELDATDTVRVRCEEYAVHARRRILLRSEGDVRTEAEDEVVSVAGGDAVHQARTTTIRSTRGDVFIEANDDARIHGERVKLNC
mgnify:CR=1 FL=1